MLDPVDEEIVLRAVRCPSPGELRGAIHEENARRQGGARLLGEELRRAQGEVAQARARVDESRAWGRNPDVTRMYEDELQAAIDHARDIQRRVTAAPAPTLVDDSPALLAEMERVFREFPRLWREGRLSPQARKAVVRLVIRQIDIPEKGDTIRVRVTLHSGQVIERELHTDQGRRRLIETLAGEGLNSQEIADELHRRRVLNHAGRPFTAAVVRAMLRRGRPRVRPVIRSTVRALWESGALPATIAEHLNAQSFRTEQRRPWTATGILRVARGLGLLWSPEAQRDRLRGPLQRLYEAGLGDEAIGAELARMGLRPLTPGTPWTRQKVRQLRRHLGIVRGAASEERRTALRDPMADLVHAGLSDRAIAMEFN